MKVQFAKSVEAYVDFVEKKLLEKEACNNLILGILERLKQNNEGAYYLGWVEKDKELLFPFMQTAPNNWVLPDLVQFVGEEVIRAAVKQIWDQGMEVPGVIGPKQYATIFAKEWQDITGNQPVVHMQEWIYQLDAVNQVQQHGELVFAQEKDLSLLIHWLQQFGEEAGVKITEKQAEAIARRNINQHSAFLWQVGKHYVSMANRSRTTKNGATINAVFTPDQHKEKGYATSLVAALSQQLLDSGYQFCSLYTDTSNPISNHVYQKIGYYKVGSAIVYSF